MLVCTPTGARAYTDRCTMTWVGFFNNLWAAVDVASCTFVEIAKVLRG